MYRVGLMVGVSVVTTLLAAQTSVLWGSQVYIMKGMHRHHTFMESGRISFDSQALEWDFSVLLAASIGLLFSHVAMLCCLYQWRDATRARKQIGFVQWGRDVPMVLIVPAPNVSIGAYRRLTLRSHRACAPVRSAPVRSRQPFSWPASLTFGVPL